MEQRTTLQSPLKQQVEDHVRSLITSGAWAPGMRMPTNQVLAATTGTSAFTVQAALAKLCREGLIERKQKTGTFVKGSGRRLNCVGMYFSGEMWTRSDFAFFQAVYAEIRERLALTGVKLKTWVDDRAEVDQGVVFPSLKHAIDQCDIQALIVVLSNPVCIEALSAISMPSAFLTTKPIRSRVSWDQGQFLELALTQLRNQGCRTVGIIGRPNVGSTFLSPDGKEVDFYQCFRNLSRDHGIETRDAWVRGCTPDDQSRDIRDYGYCQFNAIWDRPSRPEGLIVYPDVAATGVITAILARRISVPDELKLVLHANDQIPFACPVPATFLIAKVGDAAQMLLDIVHKQIQGEPVPLSPLSYSVQYSETGFPEGIRGLRDLLPQA